MEQAEYERVRDQFTQAVRDRLAEAPISRVEVLKYGDDPEVEPGQLIARIVVDAPTDPPERMRAFESFHDQHREDIHELRRELDRLSSAALLQVVAASDPSTGGNSGPRIQLLSAAPGTGGPGCEGPALTPVMARLSPDDVATLDTLITAGIATSRADAVRWTLARIRERPAFDQLRAHAREIENLKSQF